MKKVLILIGVATAIFFLSACGTTDSSDSNGSKEDVKEEETTE